MTSPAGVALVATLMAGSLSQVATATPRPHLVFVMCDDLGWNDIGFHDPRVLSPTLDRLAAEGVVLEQHYVFRYCSPTRGSFLSGRLPHHDHQSNPGGESAFGPDTRMTLLPAKLAAVGYRTAMRGSASCPCSADSQPAVVHPYPFVVLSLPRPK